MLAPMTGNEETARGVWTPAGLAIAGGMIACAGLVLHFMGRRPWCACGAPVPWSWDIWSSHNSQHLIDPYAFTHFLHGLIFYAVLRWALRGRWPLARVLLALAVELAWEIGENTNTVINAYRESTISLNYYGDSLLNSLGDVAALALGYLAAARIPVWLALALFAAIEGVLLLAIRDSLLLNVLMLLYPVPALKVWQMAGAPPV
jgi:hypothetical protein